MDQFEAAQRKHQKNLERRLRTQATQELEIAEALPDPIPKEKPQRDAIVDVRITLPTGEIELQLVSKNVLQNVNPRLLNKNEFRNRLIEGLRPLLGETK